MGTHPIFESDFDCLTEILLCAKCPILKASSKTDKIFILANMTENGTRLARDMAQEKRPWPMAIFTKDFTKKDKDMEKASINSRTAPDMWETTLAVFVTERELFTIPTAPFTKANGRKISKTEKESTLM